MNSLLPNTCPNGHPVRAATVDPINGGCLICRHPKRYVWQPGWSTELQYRKPPPQIARVVLRPTDVPTAIVISIDVPRDMTPYDYQALRAAMIQRLKEFFE